MKKHPFIVAVLLVAGLVPWVAAWRVDHALIGDDPLITLTFAKNLAAGNGFVFNTGDPVLGTTTPLFALVMAAAMALLPFLEGTAIAVWTTAACWCGLVWSFWGFRRAFGLSAEAAGWLGAAAAAGGWIAHLGMEAYPFALLSVVTAGLAFARRPAAAGVVGGLLFLTRGEGVLFFGIVALAACWFARDEWRDRSRPLWRLTPFALAVGFLVPLAAWSLYAMPTFGNIFPNTLAAKIAQVDSGLWPSFQRRLIDVWIPGWTLGPSLGTPLANAFFLLAAAGLVRIATAYPRLLVLPAWAFAYGAGYTALGVPGYPWYRLPLEFVLVACMALGLEWISARIAGPDERGLRRRLAWLPGAALLVGFALPTAHAIAEPPVREKDRAYRALAAWFDEHAGPGERIGYMEIGYLGYYSECGIVDLVGLVTPEITPRVAQRDFTSGFWELEPEYLVALDESRFILPILRDPRFAPAYRKVADLEGFEGLGLAVYLRRDRR